MICSLNGVSTVFHEEMNGIFGDWLLLMKRSSDLGYLNVNKGCLRKLVEEPPELIIFGCNFRPHHLQTGLSSSFDFFWVNGTKSIRRKIRPCQ